MVRVTGLSTADEAGLLGHKAKMLFVPQPFGFRQEDRQLKLTTRCQLPVINIQGAVEGVSYGTSGSAQWF